VMLTDVGMPVL